MVAPDAAECVCVWQVVNIPGPDVYLAAAYWSLTAITTIGFGDILPVTNAERAVMLLVEVLGVLFFGILLGSITSLLQVLCCLTSCVMLCCAYLLPHLMNLSWFCDHLDDPIACLLAFTTTMLCCTTACAPAV